MPPAGAWKERQIRPGRARIGLARFLARPAIALDTPRDGEDKNRNGSAGQKYPRGKEVPWAKLVNEQPKDETISEDTMLNACKAGKAR